MSSLLYAAHAGQHSNIDASAHLEHGVVHLQADAACGWVHHHELPRVTGAPHRVRHIAPSNSVKRACQVHCTHAHTYIKADATPDELVSYRQNNKRLVSPHSDSSGPAANLTGLCVVLQDAGMVLFKQQDQQVTLEALLVRGHSQCSVCAAASKPMRAPRAEPSWHTCGLNSSMLEMRP